MIRINQLSISIYEDDPEGAALKKAAHVLKIPEDGFRKFKVIRRSVDARDKDDIRFSYTVDVKLRDTFTGPTAATERMYIEKLHNRNVTQIDSVPVTIPECPSEKRPVIVGAGPCGLFAALTFISAGIKPIIIERGDNAMDREEKCNLFFETGKLFKDSNIQFGEGGAGLFSDGKLNTSIKGRENYVRFVLETFNEFGAPEEIVTDAKPHIGTDILKKVVLNIREYIEDNGGTYHFNTKLTGLKTENGRITGVYCEGRVSSIETDTVILCQGHSARDTYEMLRDIGVRMSKKPFAMGVRVQHPQEIIDKALYGEKDIEHKVSVLGHASYKLTHECSNERSIYSFCMCPGGYVINSSSEEGRLCINGMSYSDRESGIANSALVVNIKPEDFPGDDVLSGIEFQRSLEEKAYSLLSGLIPYETYGEFERTEEYPIGESHMVPLFLGLSAPADVRGILPAFMQEAVLEGMKSFGTQIKGFDDPDAVIAGIEARTSSPVRIERNEDSETSISGLYAAGEGAGHAGGITSAAVDGMKTAINIINKMISEE